MADDYTVALEAGAANVKKETAGKPPSDWDAEKIIETSAGVAAAAVCTAYGLGAVSFVCSAIGSKIGAFAVDIGKRIGSFFQGIFGKEPPKPSLIKSTVEQALLTVNDSAEMWLTGYANELVNVYWQDLNMGEPGEYGQRGAREDMRKIGGLAFLPRDVTLEDGWIHMQVPMPAPPNFEEDFKKYAATLNLSGGGFDALPKKQKAEIFTGWQEIHMHPWMLKVQEVTAQVALELVNRAVARETATAMTEAQQEELAKLSPQQQQQLRELEALKALSPEAQAQLKELAALKNLSPEEQEGIRQFAALQKMSPTEQEQLKAVAALNKLPPEEQARLKELEAIKKMSPEDQEALRKIAAAKAAPTPPAPGPGPMPAPTAARAAAVRYGPYPQTVAT